MLRRSFLKSTTAAALTASLGRTLAAMPQDTKYLKTMGLQLWTVRNQMKEDEKATLKAVAKAGYKQVELMSTLKSDSIVKTAKDNGMKVTSAFIDWQSLGKPNAKDAPSFDKILEKGKAIGVKHLVFGYIGKGERETVDHFKRHADVANKAGEKCLKAGIQLGYHNHSFEFAKLDGGKTGFEVLVKEFDPKLVKFELDVFWVKIGGLDPIKTLQSLKGRVSQVHLKDLIKGAKTQYDEGKVPHEAFKECGAGTIDMAKVMKVAAEVGVQQCHVEQDQSAAPLESITASMKHLRGLR